jgi:hypothetical protein
MSLETKVVAKNIGTQVTVMTSRLLSAKYLITGNSPGAAVKWLSKNVIP